MDIVDMCIEIAFVADRMFPVALLPYLATARVDAPDIAREAFLDELPAHWEIAISGRQGPDRVQMLRQDNDRSNVEGMAATYPEKGVSQQCNVGNEQRLPPIGECDREEECATGYPCASIIRHAWSVLWFDGCSKADWRSNRRRKKPFRRAVRAWRVPPRRASRSRIDAIGVDLRRHALHAYRPTGIGMYGGTR